jgi:hypothetical protein
MGRASKFLQLSRRDKAILLEAIFFLALARIFLLVAPFRWIARRLGEQTSPLKTNHPRDRSELVLRIAKMLQTAAHNAPWKTNCLVQSIAAAMMLRRRKIEGAVYFGARTDESGEFEAHAWACCGDILVTGDHDEESYTELAMFRFPKYGSTAPQDQDVSPKNGSS